MRRFDSKKHGPLAIYFLLAERYTNKSPHTGAWVVEGGGVGGGGVVGAPLVNQLHAFSCIFVFVFQHLSLNTNKRRF